MSPSDDPTALDALAVVIRYILRDHRGVRVGTVVKYDATRRTADVQPVRRRRVRGTVFDENPVVDAPVGTWRLGGMVLAGELEKGDEVLIVTCEREIRPWWLGGKAHDPQSQRMHAAEDSVILPWISNVKRVISAQAAGTLYLGREDGTAGLTITRGPAPGRTTIEGTGPGSIQLGGTASSPALMGTETVAALSAYAGTITGAVNALNTLAQAWAGLPGANQVAYATGHAAFLTAVTGAQTALGLALADALATKTVVE